MMFKTTRDVLDRIKKFHHMLSEYYEQVANTTDQSRMRLLLEFMSRHEKKFEQNINNYETGASKKILDTWFKNLPDESELIDCEEIRITPDMTTDDVIKIAFKVDDCLINFYKEMSENCVVKEIRDLFSNLCELEKREKLNFARDAAELQDI